MKWVLKRLYKAYSGNYATDKFFHDFMTHDFELNHIKYWGKEERARNYRCKRCNVSIDWLPSSDTKTDNIVEEGSWLNSCDGEIMDDALK